MKIEPATSYNLGSKATNNKTNNCQLFVLSLQDLSQAAACINQPK